MIQSSLDSGFLDSFVNITIKNPRTHIHRGKAQFTDYEINLQTNNPFFALKTSKVRRTYSEFVWLRKCLANPERVAPKDRDVCPPRLPEARHIGQFKTEFILERARGLQQFLDRLVDIRPFLVHPYLHLFLQTDLHVDGLEHYFEGLSRRSIKHVIVQMHHHKIKNDAHISSSYKSMELSSQFLNSGNAGWTKSSRGRVGLSESCSLTYSDGASNDDSANSSDSEHSDDGGLTKSWHGAKNDLIDLWLEEYEIISTGTVAKEFRQSATASSYLSSLDDTDTEDLY